RIWRYHDQCHRCLHPSQPVEARNLAGRHSPGGERADRPLLPAAAPARKRKGHWGNSRRLRRSAMKNSDTIWQFVYARKDAYEALSDRIWEIPEIAYTEFRSVAEHRAMLAEEGFHITENLAGIPTAIMGEAGDGGPVVAILGEYDALPGLSQVAGIAE